MNKKILVNLRKKIYKQAFFFISFLNIWVNLDSRRDNALHEKHLYALHR